MNTIFTFSCKGCKYSDIANITVATPLQLPRQGGSARVIRTKAFMCRTLTYRALQLYHHRDI